MEEKQLTAIKQQRTGRKHFFRFSIHNNMQHVEWIRSTHIHLTMKVRRYESDARSSSLLNNAISDVVKICNTI